MGGWTIDFMGWTEGTATCVTRRALIHLGRRVASKHTHWPGVVIFNFQVVVHAVAFQNYTSIDNDCV